jgi:hypothetical protein
VSTSRLRRAWADLAPDLAHAVTVDRRDGSTVVRVQSYNFTAHIMRVAHLCTAVCAVKICLCWYLSHHTNHHIQGTIYVRSGIKLMIFCDPLNNERPRRSSACGRGAGRSTAASAEAPCAFCFTALGYN